MFLAMALYLLLRHVSENHVRAMVILVAVGAAIVCLNGIFPVVALLVAADGSYATAFGSTGSNAIVLLLLDIYRHGSLSAAIFFGLWLAPLGYLAYTSGLFPRALGIALVAAAVCYVVDVLAALLVPDVSRQIHSSVLIVPIVAEVWMLGYLLLKGVRSAPPTTRGRAADATPALA
jgi:hypothetical protein